MSRTVAIVTALALAAALRGTAQELFRSDPHVPGEDAALQPGYVQVDDISSDTSRAIDLGATLLLPPREGVAGWRSVVSTPVGGELAFWQQKR